MSDIQSLPAQSIRRFLDAYVQTGDLRAAAKAAKISLDAHYQLLETSDSYRQSFRAAQQQAVDMLEAEAFRRALAGSDELLIFLLRAWLPERYSEHTVMELTLSEPEAEFARETLARVAAIRERVQ